MKVLVENKSNIYCPKCGFLVLDCKTETVSGELFHYNKINIICNNCITKSIVRIKL